MKILVIALASGVLAGIGVVSSAADTADEQKMFTPEEIKWSPGPA
jgi:IMP dehydrogenase/GMP reductase